MARYATIREAAEAWVNGMNAIQQGMIAKLMEADYEDWREVTKPTKGARVYVFCGNVSGDGCVTGYNREEELYQIELDNGSVVNVEEDDFELSYDGSLPMWGWMWSFGDSADDYWLEEMDGIRIMSECGFRIYESEEFGYFFGIDGAGYSFYDDHWIPLYKARGLEWHEKKEAA